MCSCVVRKAALQSLNWFPLLNCLLYVEHAPNDKKEMVEDQTAAGIMIEKKSRFFMLPW